MKPRVLICCALPALVAAVGCTKTLTEQPPTPETPTEVLPPQLITDEPLTVLCGSSFRPPLEALVEGFTAETGAEVEISFGGSEELLPQVKIGKEGDVFITHDPYLDYTDEAGALLDAVHVGFVAPVLVVAKGNPKGIASINDLAKPGIEVALPNPEYSTCGEMLFALLEKKGMKDAVVANAEGAMFRSHSETGNALKLGTREAGVMWNGTANTFKDDLDIVQTPYEYDETIKVWIIGLGYSDQPDAVMAFLDYAREHGTEKFADHGYVK